jgi:hypothetical protein
VVVDVASFAGAERMEILEALSPDEIGEIPSEGIESG